MVYIQKAKRYQDNSIHVKITFFIYLYDVVKEWVKRYENKKIEIKIM